MEWKDSGIILAMRPLGESQGIVQVFSQNYGRYKGLVYGWSRLKKSCLQIGHKVTCIWKAKLESHLGLWKALDITQGIHLAYVLREPIKARILYHLCLSLKLVAPERAPFPKSYQKLSLILDKIESPMWLLLYLEFEQTFLEELGYGLGGETLKRSFSEKKAFLEILGRTHGRLNRACPQYETLEASRAMVLKGIERYLSPSKVRGLEVSGVGFSEGFV